MIFRLRVRRGLCWGCCVIYLNSILLSMFVDVNTLYRLHGAFQSLLLFRWLVSGVSLSWQEHSHLEWKEQACAKKLTRPLRIFTFHQQCSRRGDAPSIGLARVSEPLPNHKLLSDQTLHRGVFSVPVEFKCRRN